MLISWNLLNTRNLIFIYCLVHFKFLIITVCFKERCEEYFVLCKN